MSAASELAPPAPDGLSDNTLHGKDQRYFDLMAYIVSNTISGEIMAVENYSEMVSLMPCTDSKIATVKQAAEESKHIKMLASLGKRLRFSVKTEIIEPQWHTIRGHFSTAVKHRNLAACLIIQDIMTETMAIVLYQTLLRGTDPDTTRIANIILQDELEHLEMGIQRLQNMMITHHGDVHRALVWAHHRVMPELFSMISTRCHTLCADLEVNCAGIGLDSIATDIETLRVAALDTYMDALDRVGFDLKVTMPLIASMAGYGVQPKADLRLRSDHVNTCQTSPCC